MSAREKFIQAQSAIEQAIDEQWEAEILPLLEKYIAIPNKSPHFDKDWQANGYMDQAVQLMVEWCQQQPIAGMTLDVIQEGDRTPVIFIEIPGQIDETVFFYGHLDKQPEMKGWHEGKGPWIPVREGDLLYGRGGADDGYAVFSALNSIALLQKHHIPHGRCVVLIEACEESGSYDLPFYIESLMARIGTPSLLVALDGSCGNYDQLWSMTALRGVGTGELSIKVMDAGVHSGIGGGVVPSCFMILQQLLQRVEDPQTGQMIDDFQVNISDQRREQAYHAGEVLGEGFFKGYPFAEGVQPLNTHPGEAILNNCWRPCITVTGVDGLPAVENAGNTLLPEINVAISMRFPPGIDAKEGNQRLKEVFEENPPLGAHVSYTTKAAGSGWSAPEVAPWLATASDLASDQFFGKPCQYIGLGGSIPFMNMLGELFPKAQFLITGVLGPNSNAHGPNEFLHVPMVKKLTGCMASLLASHFDAFE